MRRLSLWFLISACHVAGADADRGPERAGAALVSARGLAEPSIIADQISYDTAVIVGARAGNEWLIAWHDWRFDAEVYSMRLDLEGRPLQGTTRLLSQLGDEPWPPDLATDGTAWLLSWGDCTSGDTRVVLARPGGALGREVVLNPGGCSRARVAWGPAGYLVTAPNGNRVTGWFFDSNGVQTGGPLSLPGHVLASDGTRYLAAWTAGAQLFVARVEPDGGVLDDGGLRIPTTATQITQVSAVGTPAGFAVAFGHQITNMGTTVRGIL